MTCQVAEQWIKTFKIKFCKNNKFPMKNLAFKTKIHRKDLYNVMNEKWETVQLKNLFCDHWLKKTLCKV